MGIGMVAGGLGWWHRDRDGDTGLVAQGRGPGFWRPGSAPLSPRSYYGLTVWFPDMIKHLQNIEYASRTKLFTREKVRHFTFNFTLENQIHQGGEYFNDKCVAAGDGDTGTGGSGDGSEPFSPLFLPHSQVHRPEDEVGDVRGLAVRGVLLRGHHLQQHLLQELHLHLHRLLQHRYERGRGRRRTPPSILAALFTTHLGSPPLADLFEYKFINSRVLNSTFLHNKEGCQLDFSDDNNAYMIYFVSFLGTLAVLPGNIVSALLMDKIGRLRMLGGHPQFHPHQVFFLGSWTVGR